MPDQLFIFDSLAVISSVAFAVLWLITIAAAPRRDLAKNGLANLALILLGSLLAYFAGSIWVFLAGWFLSSVPFLSASGGLRTLPKASLIFSAAAIAAGGLLWSLPPTDNTHRAAFAAFVLAALLRKGMFPFHFWVTSAFETSPLPALSLLMNGHLGAFLLIRFAVPLMPERAAEVLPAIAILALFTAVFAAVRALAETKPRKILALLCVSQASFVLSGLQSRNVEGITGALVLWWVIAFATTGMIAVYRSLEARTPEVESPRGYLGFAVPAPRLAVFFALSGLALVGLPGTLGFAAEDLLFHGALESHPLLGIALPLATALNAITVFRLFATLFMGRRGIHAPPISDAKPAERWALTAVVAFLVVGGLAPGVLVALRSAAAQTLANLLAERL
ncbi:MAG: proton-conducting transporter membrane subunit [Acidobacteriota bacterium]